MQHHVTCKLFGKRSNPADLAVHFDEGFSELQKASTREEDPTQQGTQITTHVGKICNHMVSDVSSSFEGR